MKCVMTLRFGLFATLASGLFALSTTRCGSGDGAPDGGVDGCLMTPAHCAVGYKFDAQSCGCDPVSCTTNADCANLGQVVCDTSTNLCVASSTLAECAAVFTCQNAIKAGGTCDCHLDCQCDPTNASGLGSTSCVGPGGTCMPRCTDQQDPALFCDCYTVGTKCAPTGSCAYTCNMQSDCTIGTCTNGFCIVPVDDSINTAPCADGGANDAALEGGG